MALDLQVILDAATGGGDSAEQRQTAITDALGDASRADLDTLINDVVDQFTTLNAAEPTDAESLLGLELLAEIATTARIRQTDLDADAERIKGIREGLAKKVLGEAAAAPKSDAGEDEPKADTPDEATADKVTEPAVDDATPDAPAAEATPEPAAPDATAEPELEAVAASAKAPTPVRRFNLSTIKDKAPQPKAPEPAGVTIIAAGDVRGFKAGQHLDLPGLYAAAAEQVSGMPKPYDRGQVRPEGDRAISVRSSIAQFRNHFPAELVASGRDATAEIERAVDQSRLKGGSLIAAGGWCAPSERFYELLPLLADPNAGLIDVPEIAAKRGGIITAGGLDFATVWAGDVGLIQTETQAEAGTTKSLYRPTCPDDTETRADVIYSGLEVGILQDNAYPEVTRQAIEGVLAVHAHRINASTISRIEALATEVDLTNTLGPSATGAILNGLELVIVDARYRYRMPESTTLEVILPIWVKSIIRSDLALRAGDGQFVQVSDQQITSFFGARGAKVQFVYDWQDAFSADSGFGGTDVITEFPTTVNALVYPAGAFVRIRGEVVNLDTVYDSTNIVVNDYLRLFMEEKLAVHQRGYQILDVALPLGVRGSTGAAEILDDNGRVASGS
ncbi:MAG: major capsid protein [Gordonia sp. (in: high G+C Gram-positive bacteria)]